MKQDWKPGTMIYPLPALLVSCGNCESEYNNCSMGWYDLYQSSYVLYFSSSGTPLPLHY